MNRPDTTIRETTSSPADVDGKGGVPAEEGGGFCDPAESELAPSCSRAGRPDTLFRGAAANILASICSVGFAVITSIVLARTVGPEGKGRYDLVNATIMLATSLFGLSLESGINYWVAKGAFQPRRLMPSLAAIAALQMIAVWAAVWLFSQTPLAKAILPVEYLSWGPAVVAAGAAAMLLWQYASAVLAGLQRFVLCAWLTVTNRFLVTVAVVLSAAVAIWMNSRDIMQWAIWAMVGSLCVTSLLIQFSALAQTPRKTVSAGLADIFHYSAPCYVANLAQFLSYRVDVFFVAYYVGERELALYTTAVSLSQLLWLPSRALQGVLFPNLTSLSDASAQAARAAKAARSLLALLGVLGIGMALLGPGMILLLFGQRFRGSIPALWLLLPGIVLFCIPQALACYLGAIGKPRWNLVASLAGLVVTLILNVVLVPTIGIAGAAITSSLSYITTAVAVLYFFSRESKCHLRDVLCVRPRELRELTAQSGHPWLVRLAGATLVEKRSCDLPHDSV